MSDLRDMTFLPSLSFLVCTAGHLSVLLEGWARLAALANCGDPGSLSNVQNRRQSLPPNHNKAPSRIPGVSSRQESKWGSQAY